MSWPETEREDGEPYYNLGLSDEDMLELIWLIADEPTSTHPVDEERLERICSRLKRGRKRLRKRLREEEGT